MHTVLDPRPLTSSNHCTTSQQRSVRHGIPVVQRRSGPESLCKNCCSLPERRRPLIASPFTRMRQTSNDGDVNNQQLQFVSAVMTDNFVYKGYQIIVQIAK